MRNTMSRRTLLPGEVTVTESPEMFGRVAPDANARLNPVRTCAAAVSIPAGTSASFRLAENVSLIRFQIDIVTAPGGAPSTSITEMLSKNVPWLMPPVGEQVAEVSGVNV